MSNIISLKSGLARLLRYKLVILAGLIAGSFLLSVYTASARPAAPGWMPNGSKYTCNTCHVSGDLTYKLQTQMLLDFWHTTPTIKTWTVALAHTDSDGDGWTNGEELQDPDGAWAVGKPDPGVLARVSNPSRINEQPPTPQIRFNGVAAADTLNGQVAISTQVIAGYPTDLTRVVFELANFDDQVVYAYTDTSAPFCFTPTCAPWDSTSVPNGVYTIREIAADKRSAAAGGPRTIYYAAGIYIDNPEPPSVEFKRANYTASEGDGTATIVVELSKPWDKNVTVAYVASDGTAKAPGDYSLAAGTLTFAPNVTSATFQVSIADDTLDESNEMVKLVLSDPSNATLGNRAKATVTIVDDDDPPALPSVSISVDDPAAAEAGLDDGALTVVRSGSTAAPLTVDYTVGGTATAGADYIPLAGSLIIPVGESSVAIEITPLDDTALEAAETVMLSLSPRADYTIGAPASATVLIADDDQPQSPEPNPEPEHRIYLPLVIRAS